MDAFNHPIHKPCSGSQESPLITPTSPSSSNDRCITPVAVLPHSPTSISAVTSIQSNMSDSKEEITPDTHLKKIWEYRQAYHAVVSLVIKSQSFVLEGQGNMGTFVGLIERLAIRENNDAAHLICDLPEIAKSAPGLASNLSVSVYDMLSTKLKNPTTLSQPDLEKQAENFRKAAEADMMLLRKGLIAMLAPVVHWPQGDMVSRAQLCLCVKNIDIQGIAKWGASNKWVSGFLEEWQATDN